MKKKTLLLCFIHGFKGGDNTFVEFPQHLSALVGHALPDIAIREVVYPKYETRGDLNDCVARFKEWLQSKVLDLEIANENDKPILNPSVNVILVGHSMGGIVAVETLFSIKSDEVAPSPLSPNSEGPTFMFPFVRGILAFDTPYFGISPSVVAHGTEGHWNAAASAYSTLTNVAGTFGWGAAKSASESAAPVPANPPAGALPESEQETSKSRKNSAAAASTAAAAATNKWGRGAMILGAVGAVAMTGAAAYYKRDALSAGWTWVGSHLEFVGCLARPADLEKRMARLVETIQRSETRGFADIYTTLGAAVEGKTKVSSGLLGESRTFCALPKSEIKRYFIPMKNDKAYAETTAHMTMFVPTDNPSYYSMAETAKELVHEWIHKTNWYVSAAPEAKDSKPHPSSSPSPKQSPTATPPAATNAPEIEIQGPPPDDTKEAQKQQVPLQEEQEKTSEPQKEQQA